MRGIEPTIQSRTNAYLNKYKCMGVEYLQITHRWSVLVSTETSEDIIPRYSIRWLIGWLVERCVSTQLTKLAGGVGIGVGGRAVCVRVRIGINWVGRSSTALWLALIDGSITR